jgi:hypothetical protein
MVPTLSDELPISAACEIAGVSRQLRANWISRKLVGGTRSGTSRVDDLLELVAFAALVEVLGFDEARVAWQDCRDHVQLGRRLDVVFDIQLKSAEVASDDRAIVRAVRHGRPVRVVGLAEPLRRAGRAAERVIRARSG